MFMTFSLWSMKTPTGAEKRGKPGSSIALKGASQELSPVDEDTNRGAAVVGVLTHHI